MRILIVRMYADNLNIKNYNCQELGLAKALIKRNHQCDIVLYTDKKAYEEDVVLENNKKIHIYYLNAKNILKNAIFESKLYEIVKNYDIIQTAEYDQIGNVKLQKMVNNKMIIYHGPYSCNFTRGYNIKCIFSDIYYIFCRKYKNVQCIAKSALAEKLLIKKGFRNVTTIGVGLDGDRFNNTLKSNEQIKKIIEEKEAQKLKYLLYIGKLEERRNILFLIDVLEKVCNKNEKIRLILVGKGDSKYVDKCMKYAENKNLKNKIIHFESISQTELPNLYKNSEIFLLPTQYEIFGMVLLEAMYFGIPVITTLNGGSSTLIENEKNGIICSLDNISSWEEYINKIINDDAYRKRISIASCEQINNNYMWDRLADKFLDIYSKVYQTNEK